MKTNKNVFLLPTDKPSNLISSGKEFALLKNPTLDKRCKNIYITNSEEIRKPCWCWDIIQKRIYWVHDTIPKYPTIGNYFKKIILTTDLELQKDGVQAIDDEFLEWIIKNPTCEEVKIESETLWLNKRYRGIWQPFPDESATEKKKNYKIIIPKEETQFYCSDCNKSLEECNCIEDTVDIKQKTLEKVAEKYIEENIALYSENKWMYKKCFIDGYWLAQQERSYSEEDMEKYAEYRLELDSYLLPKDWFKTFKKK
jgi:hypothetical protein